MENNVVDIPASWAFFHDVGAGLSDEYILGDDYFGEGVGDSKSKHTKTDCKDSKEGLLQWKVETPFSEDKVIVKDLINNIKSENGCEYQEEKDFIKEEKLDLGDLKIKKEQSLANYLDNADSEDCKGMENQDLVAIAKVKEKYSLDLDELQNNDVIKSIMQPKPSCSPVQNFQEEQILPDIISDDFQLKKTHDVENKPSLYFNEQQNSDVLITIVQQQPSSSPVQELQEEQILPDILSNDFHLEKTHIKKEIDEALSPKISEKIDIDESSSDVDRGGTLSFEEEESLANDLSTPRTNLTHQSSKYSHGKGDCLNAVSTAGLVTQSLWDADPTSQYSYFKMICLAILSTPKKQITLNGILRFLSENFPHCRSNTKLKSTIKDYLYRSKYFIKLILLDNSVQQHWAMTPAVEKKMILQVNQTSVQSGGKVNHQRIEQITKWTREKLKMLLERRKRMLFESNNEAGKCTFSSQSPCSRYRSSQNTSLLRKLLVSPSVVKQYEQQKNRGTNVKPPEIIEIDD